MAREVKNKGYGPALTVAGVCVAIVLASLGFASDWGGADVRLDNHERRLDIVEGLVRDMGKEVTETRADVRWLREREEGK